MYSNYLTDDSIVLLDGVRTPTGRLTGGLSDYEAVDLGALCLKELEGIVDPRQVDEVLLGSVIQAGQGQAPARQVLLGADWSPKIPAVTVNKVCGSGIKTILQGIEGLAAGPQQQVVAGGMESMTNAPHLLQNFREGQTMGDGELIDSAVHDGLWCSIESEHMGSAAERIADRYDLSRDELDEFALRSHQRADRAEEKGFFDSERMDLPELDRDEPVRPDTTLEKLSELRPAFASDGVVTAGNAPGLNDGAAAVGLAKRSLAENDSSPESVFAVKGYSVVGTEPGNLFETPAAAIEMLLEGRSWTLEDFDRVEINEAFASQVLANCHRLELSPDRINGWGGAIALGHPIGMSGTRIVLTLMEQMRHHQDELGVASICMGGGNGIALALEQQTL
ncbi:MAG: acetyl-CoA C-acyltransferase [bacterium]